MRILIGLVFLLNLCFANIGQVTALVGDASITRGEILIPAKLGLKIENKDIIKTLQNSKLQIIFTDNTIVTIGKNSALNINDYLYDEKKPETSKTKLNFFKGSFKTITGRIGKINKKRFKLKTKSASIGIRGTFVIGDQDMVACIDGAITVENSGIAVNIAANEFTLTKENKPPTPPRTLKQENLQNLQDNIEPKKDKKREEKDNQQGNPSSENKPVKESPSEASTSKEVNPSFEGLLNDVEKIEQQSNHESTKGKIDEVVDNIANNSILSFEGKVQGVVYHLNSGTPTTPSAIIQDSTNKVSLDFDIGGGKSNMTGTMKFRSDFSVADHANLFNYDLSSTDANLNDDSFSVKAVHKDLETEYDFNLNGNSESVKTAAEVNLSETCVDGFIHKADITFEATKK